jgi:hypothetical protein
MFLVLMNVVLGLTTLALSGALAYALVLSSGLRKTTLAHLPEPWRSNLSSLFFSLWLVIVILATSSIARLVYAGVGFYSDAATAVTGILTALAAFSCYHVTVACMNLRAAQ